MGTLHVMDHPLVAHKMTIIRNKHTSVKDFRELVSEIGMLITYEATREHNDSNIICLGERIVGPGLAMRIVDTWLEASFQGGRHQVRVDMISELEN